MNNYTLGLIYYNSVSDCNRELLLRIESNPPYKLPNKLEYRYNIGIKAFLFKIGRANIIKEI